MPHFVSKEGEPFDWKAFQKHMNFSDEELEAWKNNPQKAIPTEMMCSPEVQGKYLIVEVVKSHGCANGMKPGDRLVFKGMGNLVPERSSNWCGHNLGRIMMFQDACHNFYFQGKDPNDIYPKYFSCVDTTMKYGWGYVENKVYVVDEDDLDRLDEISKTIS